jgi:hypothetical protein
MNPVSIVSSFPIRKGTRSSESLSEAASLLKLTHENVQAVFQSGRRLPIARTASRDEAQLVHDRLQELRIATLTLSDETLE